jgi:hypothetical protein
VASIAKHLRDERDEGERGVRTIVLAAGSEHLGGSRAERHAYRFNGEPGHFVFVSSPLKGRSDDVENYPSYGEALKRFRSLTDGEETSRTLRRAA